MRYLFALLLFSSILGQSQTMEIHFEGAERIYNDILGNFYLVKGPEIRKFDSRGNLTSSYSNPIGSEIQTFDPSISTTVLTYHQPFQELVVLDNTLNRLFGPLYLIEFGYSDVTLVHSSDEQNVWMYDRSKNQLSKFNFTTRTEVWSSPNLDQMYTNNGDPDKMIHTISGLFLRYPGQGVAQFDIYGNFIQFISLNSTDRIFVMNCQILWNEMGQIRFFDLKTLGEFSYSLRNSDWDDFSIYNKHIYLLKDGKVAQENLF